MFLYERHCLVNQTY